VRDLEAWILELNELRDVARGTRAGPAIEELLERLFHARGRLAVYGSLQPGAQHEGELAGIRGRWIAGHVHGRLEDRGWGAGLGYPALRLEPHGPRVAVQVLEASDLARKWRDLDEFEGDEYRRSLAPIFDDDDVLCGVANLYEARESS